MSCRSTAPEIQRHKLETRRRIEKFQWTCNKFHRISSTISTFSQEAFNIPFEADIETPIIVLSELTDRTGSEDVQNLKHSR